MWFNIEGWYKKNNNYWESEEFKNMVPVNLEGNQLKKSKVRTISSRGRQAAQIVFKKVGFTNIIEKVKTKDPKIFSKQLTHLAKQIKSPMMHDAGLTVQTVKTENGGVTNFHTTEITYTSKQHYNSRLHEAVSMTEQLYFLTWRKWPLENSMN